MRTTTKLLLANAVITLAVVLLFALFTINRIGVEGIREEQKDLEHSIQTFWAMAAGKGGQFKISDGKLMIDDYVVNGNFELPDRVQGIFGCVATVFMGDVRVATNILDEHGRRAVGTRLADPVRTTVLNLGLPYRGEANILGQTYLTAYDPIKDARGTTIGALFVGMKKSTLLDNFSRMKSPVLILAMVLLTSLGIVTALLWKITSNLENTDADNALFLKTLLETIPSPIFYKDAEGRYLGFNKAYEAFIGIPSDQLIGRTVFDLWPRDLAERFHAQDESLFANPGTQQYEGKVEIAGGTRLDVIFYKATFHSRSGALAGLVGVILDITARKSAEEETRKAYQQLHDIIEFLPDATFVVDQEQKVIAWNLAMEKMTGVAKDEILGQGDYAYALPFYGERRPILIDMTNDENLKERAYYPLVTKNGRTLYAETFLPEVNGRKNCHMWGTAAPLYDKLGNHVGSIESIRDISEFKNIEAELRFRNLLLSSQYEASIDGILAVDEHARIVSWNHRFAEIFSIPIPLFTTSDDEPVLQTVTRQMKDPDIFLERVRYIYRNQHGTYRDEIQLKNGTIIDRHTAPMLDAAGKYYGRVWYFRDITQEKHAEEVRLQYEGQQRQARMLETFVTRLGHDLRTPITPLFTLIPLMMDRVTDDGLRKMLEICRQSVSCIHEMTEKSLKFVNLSTTAGRTHEPVYLADVVRSCLSEARDAGERKGIVWETDIAPGLKIHAISRQISELFSNLISNALRYSSNGDTIRIEAQESDGKVAVAVHDQGIGVDPGHLERIFEEYFKVDESRHDLWAPGLGLSLCRKIVTNHRGSIWAESRGIGHGLSVRFILPRGDSPRDTQSQEAS